MAGAMKFWGVEVKPKEPCQVSLEDGFIIHVSQVTLSDIKKDNEPVIVHVKVGDKKLVMGILSQNNSQLSSDLVFDGDFEVSHNWKNGSIHLIGYQAVMGENVSDFDLSDEEEEDVPVAKENGQLAAPAGKAPVVNSKADKSKPEEKAESDQDDSSEEEDDDDEDDSDDVEADEEMGMSDSDGDEDDSDDSEEETPAKVVDTGKKRPNADAKTPQSKKAKIVTPQKTDGKKGPQPSKKGGDKTPKSGGGGDKTSKSGGSDVSCGSCKKSFKSEVALQSHSKAKHGAK